ncbi:MAG: WecB/TagA/CpsF family glycosyltransferase [Rubrivivax sp.]|nr:WecB/TagA/CpsF family glycosyltransferase [Rubrivivax sp.]
MPNVTNPDDTRRTLPVLHAPIDAISCEGAVARIASWAAAGASRVVCICNAHSVVTAEQDAGFLRAIVSADMATPDGAPVAWMLRRQGVTGQSRVSGPDLMLDYCAYATRVGEPIFLYGSTEQTLQALRERLGQRWPGLQIAGALSPPFRPLSEAEDSAIVAAINASGARTVWVSLGCPKQELWMQAHRGRVQAVMVGVGAAFDFHAGTLARAPRWMQDHGLEWLHRLGTEPARLWRRYLFTNTAFVFGAARQLISTRR